MTSAGGLANGDQRASLGSDASGALRPRSGVECCGSVGQRPNRRSSTFFDSCFAEGQTSGDQLKRLHYQMNQAMHGLRVENHQCPTGLQAINDWDLNVGRAN